MQLSTKEEAFLHKNVAFYWCGEAYHQFLEYLSVVLLSEAVIRYARLCKELKRNA